jgi:hypothetical protein
MATAYIEEYAQLMRDSTGEMGYVPVQPSIATQTVTYTGTAGQSAAFSSKTRMVRIHADGICSYLFGANPTATTAKPRMAASTTEYFGVQPGDKVSFIVNT